MSLDASNVEKIAHLARLAIEPEAVSEYARNLSDILDLVDQLSTVDTKDIEPMAHPMDVVQRLRPDQVTEQDQRETFQAIAPQVEDGLYLVPRVVE